MKLKGILLWTCACLIVVTMAAFAADSDEAAASEETAVQRPQRQARPLPGRGPIAAPGQRGRGAAAAAEDGQQTQQRGGAAVIPGGREDMVRQAMARRMEQHREEIAKLEAIVKIAEAEEATKTVEALKALIAEKDKEMKDQIEQAERRRQELQERLQERLEDRSRRPGVSAEDEIPGRPPRPETAQPRGQQRQAPQRGRQQQND